VFGSAYVAAASAVLTLLILIFSEIIPKTLGAHYWRSLAPVTAHVLKFLIWFLYPFVKLSEKLTSGMVEGPTLSGFSRAEFSAMVDVSAEEGQLEKQESSMLKNLLLLNAIRVEEVMTPRTVIFSLSESSTVETFFHKYDDTRFSRIPIYSDGNQEQIIGFVLRSDLLLAQSRGNTTTLLKTYCREIHAILDSTKVAKALEEFIGFKSQLMLVIDEYGGVEGLVTLEDLLETMLGLEIVDESDKTIDMQQLALKLARRKSLIKKTKEDEL
jgi:magnesium and cobalt exporter, CNNM family